MGRSDAHSMRLILGKPHREVLYNQSRFLVLNAGRGFGKTQLILARQYRHLQRAYSDRYGNPLTHKIWYLSPIYKQGRRDFWPRLKTFWGPLIASKSETDLTLRLVTGAEITIVGSEQFDTLRGPYLTLAQFDEAAFHHQHYWDRVIRPMLGRVAPLGGAEFYSTPDGRNEFYDLFVRGGDVRQPEWASYHYSTAEGGFIPASEVEAAKSGMTFEHWRQEYFAEFITPTNTVYYKFDRSKHGRPVKFLPELTIHWSWDFNVKPAVHSVLAHHHKGKSFVFDEIAVGNTPSNVDEFCSRYPKDRVAAIKLYGDYNGTLGTNGTTDYMEIQKTLYERGYPYPELCVYGGNPIVRSRTNNFNRLLEDAAGDVRYYVNIEKCPRLVRDLEQVRWAEKSSDIDKSTDPTLTHASDAEGYRLWVMDTPEWATRTGRPKRPPVMSEQYSSGGWIIE